MIDLRYLVVSLIGVFLALAVGMMIGSALGGPDKRDAAYEGLRRQFDLLRTDNQRVHDENDLVRRRLTSRDQALQELQPLAIRHRLEGSVVGVVICGSWDERGFWSDLENAIQLAGGQIGPVVRVPDHLDPLSPADRSRFQTWWQPEDGGTSTDAFDPARWLVHGLSRNGTSPRIEDLIRRSGMDLRSRYAGSVRRLLVLTSVPDDERATAVEAGQVPDGAVVDAARADGLRVVAAEPESSLQSAVEPLHRRGVTTVDNIDTAGGQISAVLALAGEAEGRFGSKPGAARSVPPLTTQ